MEEVKLRKNISTYMVLYNAAILLAFINWTHQVQSRNRSIPNTHAQNAYVGYAHHALFNPGRMCTHLSSDANDHEPYDNELSINYWQNVGVGLKIR